MLTDLASHFRPQRSPGRRIGSSARSRIFGIIDNYSLPSTRQLWWRGKKRVVCGEDVASENGRWSGARRQQPARRSQLNAPCRHTHPACGAANLP